MRATFAIFAAMTLLPMSAGAQTDAFCVAVHDSTGARVARAHTGGQKPQPASVPATDEHSSDAEMFFVHDGRVAKIVAKLNELVADQTVFFTGANCTGDAYMERGGLAASDAQLQPDGSVTYPDTTADEVIVAAVSQRANTGICSGNGLNWLVVPAFNFTIPTFTPPFHLEPEPCFTPEDPDPEQFINGCIKKNGTIKVVDDPVECASGETPISWLVNN
jgi:hypothetical protein